MPTANDNTSRVVDDLGGRSDDEPCDILTRIDSRQFPQRYAVVHDEFPQEEGRAYAIQCFRTGR